MVGRQGTVLQQTMDNQAENRAGRASMVGRQGTSQRQKTGNRIANRASMVGKRTLSRMQKNRPNPLQKV